MLESGVRHIDEIEGAHDNTVGVYRLIRPNQVQDNVATWNHATLKPGQKVTEHEHKDGDEFFWFLIGNAIVTLGDTAHEVGPHDLVTVARGTRHSIKNETSSTVEFMSLRLIQQND